MEKTITNGQTNPPPKIDSDNCHSVTPPAVGGPPPPPSTVDLLQSFNLQGRRKWPVSSADFIILFILG